MATAFLTLFFLFANSCILVEGIGNIVFSNSANPQAIPVDYGAIQNVLINRLGKPSKPQNWMAQQLQDKVRNELSHRINICHDRFQRCSEQLSRDFCASNSRKFSFYLWAKMLAKQIMEGNDGIHCPDELLDMFHGNWSLLTGFLHIVK